MEKVLEDVEDPEFCFVFQIFSEQNSGMCPENFQNPFWKPENFRNAFRKPENFYSREHPQTSIHCCTVALEKIVSSNSPCHVK